MFKKRLGYGLQIVLVGMLTGLFAGVVVTFYNILAVMAEDFARGYYGFFRDNPAFIPLLFAALFLGAVVVGGTLRFLPMIRGSGIPQAEGALRGLLRFRWYRVLTGMFAASLFTVFMGISAGAEGPSVLIGSCCGYGTSDLLRRGSLVRRYQITGGACAGLAVAFNAPLTGMAFAFEEGQKRFTPEVFGCAFTSVAVAVIVRNLLRSALGLDTSAYLTTFSFAEAELLSPLFYVCVLGAAVVCALAGVGFYHLIFLAKKLFARVRLWKGIGRMLPPFLLAGALGLVTVYAVGGGHGFIADLGSGSEGVQSVFGAPLWATILLVVAVRALVTAVNMGAGVPCGAFVPMLSVGAGLGALMSLLFAAMGLDASYADALIVICMAAFFTSVVKAPITGLVMTLELTWDFLFLLPAVIGVGAGYIVGLLFRTKPIYDRLLEEMPEAGALSDVRPFAARFRVLAGSVAAERALRDILLPVGTRVTRVEGKKIVRTPDGNTVLHAGDFVTVAGEVRTGDGNTVLHAGDFVTVAGEVRTGDGSAGTVCGGARVCGDDGAGGENLACADVCETLAELFGERAEEK